MPFRRPAACLFGLFLLASPLQAQLRGTVRDPAGAPLDSVTVEDRGRAVLRRFLA